MMLRDVNVTGVMISWGTPAGLRPYLGEGSFPGFDAPKRVAEALLASSDISTQAQLGSALGNHLDDRLQAMLDGLGEIAELTSAGPRRECWDEAAVLVLVQTDDERAAFMTPSQARCTGASFTLHDLSALRRRAQALAHERDQVRAFAEFADIEDAFEPVEMEVENMLVAIDREVQLQIDIARGK